MQPTVGHLVQPAAHLAVGGGYVQQQPTAAQGRRQRHHETALQIAIEPIDLALGPGPVGSADPGGERALLGQGQHLRAPAVPARSVHIPVQQHRLGVVEQHVLRHAAEVVEGPDQPRLPGREALLVAEPHVRGAAVAQRGHEGHQPVTSAPDGGEVRLHLLARCRLEPDHRVGRGAAQRCHEGLQLADPAAIASFSQLPQQPRRRDHIRVRRCQA